MPDSLKTSESPRKFTRLYADYIRSFAAMAVVTIHSTGSYLTAFNPADNLDVHWWTGNIYCSLLRWATPFFILLSGGFLLDPGRHESTAPFLKKRISRVLLPFAFWTVVYTLYQYRESFFSGQWPGWKEVFNRIFFEDVYYHLWFVPMIVSLYLLTPIFRIFIRHAHRQEIEYFLGIAFFITAMQHLFPGFFIVEYVGWLGYIGFYVLGYYLSTYRLPERLEKRIYALALLMPIVTAIGTWMLSVKKGAHDQSMYIYFSPNVVIMVVAFFSWLRWRDWSAFADRFPRFDRFIHHFAALSFGVYFIHALMLDILKNGYIAQWHTTTEMFFNHPVNPLVGAVPQALLVLALSYGTIYVMSKLPAANKWLM
ncbi:MAG: acyltransferase family protein [Saprospiraceae bacterium]|nr:acyltransferase family protein [Saprospiraceae bacterium]